jgi:hypothetical protein
VRSRRTWLGTLLAGIYHCAGEKNGPRRLEMYEVEVHVRPVAHWVGQKRFAVVTGVELPNQWHLLLLPRTANL